MNKVTECAHLLGGLVEALDGIEETAAELQKPRKMTLELSQRQAVIDGKTCFFVLDTNGMPWYLNRSSKCNWYYFSKEPKEPVGEIPVGWQVIMGRGFPRLKKDEDIES